MSFLILLNGPPRSGKDTLANELVDRHMFEKRRFAQPLRDAIAAFFGLTKAEIDDIVENHKGTPHESLYGAEIRDLMIDLSERWAKPRCGQDVFGKLFARYMKDDYGFLSMPGLRIVVADTGFPYEPREISSYVDNWHKLVVHINRDGCEWDSRHPIPTPEQLAWDDNQNSKELWSWVGEFDHIEIDNSELSLEEYAKSGMNMIEAWMNSKA